MEDPALRAQVKAFFGQEGHHAKAHERFFDLLREQGYEIDRFLRAYERIAYDGIERLCSPELRLSATAALEHYTAILAEEALQEGTLDLAHPTARALLLWHAAEEIEHKTVAFDVLKAIDPSHRLRMRGFALATSTLAMFWLAALLVLLVQELPAAASASAKKSTERIPPVRRRFIVRRVFLRGAREYVRRDFHPLPERQSPPRQGVPRRDRRPLSARRPGLAGWRARRKATLAAQRGILPQQRHPA